MQHEIHTASIMQRLDRLERQNRLMKFALATMALGVGALCLVAAAPLNPETVTAKKFVLVDDGGLARGVLETTNGNPDLVLNGTDGQRAVFGIAPTGPPRFILSGAADAMIEASVLQTGGLAHLAIESAKDNALSLMAISHDAVGILADSSDGEGIELTAGPYPGHKDGPALTLYGDTKPRLTLGVASLTNGKTGGSTETPVSTITAFDKKGNFLGSWP
jgi:hypothetical protein